MSKISLIGIGWLLLLAACTTTSRISSLNLDVMVPAKIPLSPQNHKIAAVYRNLRQVRPPEIQQPDSDGTPENIDSIASWHYFRTFCQTLEEIGYFDTICQIVLKPVPGDSLELPPLTPADWQEIRSVLPDAGAVLAFDFFITEGKTSYWKEFNIFNKEVLTTAVWQIILPDSVHYLYQKTDTTWWEGEAFSQLEMRKKLPPPQTAVLEGAAEAGRAFAQKLAPHWETVERVLYLSGNYELQAATQLALNNEWLQAAEIWKRHIASPNKNIVAKCTFNLALASEMAGNFEAALDWAIRSYYIFNEQNPEHAARCKAYIRILSQRKAEISQLDNQLGRVN